MTANMTMVTHTAILDDNTSENGTMKMERTKSGTEAMIDFTGAKNRRTIGFSDKTIQLYFPKTQSGAGYTGRKANLLDQYLLLGFGTSGKDLTKGLQRADGGNGTDFTGKPATKLVLVPKAESERTAKQGGNLAPSIRVSRSSRNSTIHRETFGWHVH